LVSEDIGELLEKMENYQPIHHDKWLNREQV
jgi:hypothetical protein